MRNFNRNVIVVLALLLACMWGGAVKASADEDVYAEQAEICRNLTVNFFRNLKEGRSVWNDLTVASKEYFINMFLETMREEEEEVPLSDNSLRAIMEIELADENSEMSKIVWQGMSECLDGSELPEGGFDVKVEGREAYAFINEGFTLRLFYEGNSWKVGFFESIEDAESEADESEAAEQ